MAARSDEFDFCLRVDLDYVPWDTPDALEYGHSEPAVFLRLIELSRQTGMVMHFFASTRVLRAFPATADTVLNEGHALDWLCKHPGDAERWEEAEAAFTQLGHQPIGIATKSAWPKDAIWPSESLQFLSAPKGSSPKGVRLLPVSATTLREAAYSGTSVRKWADDIRAQVRDSAARRLDTTIVVRPQVLGKFDPKLHVVKEILFLARAVGFNVGTLRQRIEKI